MTAGTLRFVRSVDPRRWALERVLAVSAWAISVVALTVSVWIWAGQRFAGPPVSFTTGPVVIGEIVLALAYATVGWVLASRRARNIVGWAFLGIGASTALQLPVTVVVAQAHQVLRPIDPMAMYAAWLASSAHLPFAAALAITVFAVFPNGTLPAGWDRVPVLLGVVGMGLVAIASGLSPAGLIWYPSLPNPFAAGADAMPQLKAMSILGAALGIAGLVIAVVRMVRKYACCDPVEKAQLRWIVYAIVLMGVTGIPFLAVRYVMGASGVLGGALLFGLVVSASFLPIASAAAILRYRLFEIDLIINRTLVYVPLLAFVGGLFTASITLSQRLFVGMTGDTSDIAVVLATLLVASAITPVRRGLEILADRYIKPTPARRATMTSLATPLPQPIVRPVLEAAGYIVPEAPEPRAPEAPDLAEVVARLNERIQTLESRLAADAPPDGKEAAVTPSR